MLPQLSQLLSGHAASFLVERFQKIVTALSAIGYGDRVRIDFSVVHDMSYYNGIVFKGFVNGVPTSVLSGGQYDRLMQKLGKKSRAIGFAVYLDLLERMVDDTTEYDVHTVLLYDEKTDLAALANAVQSINLSRGNSVAGDSVMALPALPEGLRYKKLVRLTASGMEEVK